MSTMHTTGQAADAAQDYSPGINHTGGAPIRVRAVNGWYGEFQSLYDMSLDMPARKVTALIGPSGCGKSTFLRWINRMNDQIDSARIEGSIEINGENVLAPKTDVVELRRHVGMVFQKPNPFPKSIFDNVAFGPRLHYKLSKSDLDGIVERSLKGASLWKKSRIG